MFSLHYKAIYSNDINKTNDENKTTEKKKDLSLTSVLNMHHLLVPCGFFKGIKKVILFTISGY